MMDPKDSSPENIRDVAHLEDLLSTPTEAAIEGVRRCEGDFVVLGAAGKMGPSLSRMIRRALDQLGLKNRVIAVSRFSSPSAEDEFRRHGIETIKADLLNQQQ